MCNYYELLPLDTISSNFYCEELTRFNHDYQKPTNPKESDKYRLKCFVWKCYQSTNSISFKQISQEKRGIPKQFLCGYWDINGYGNAETLAHKPILTTIDTT